MSDEEVADKLDLCAAELRHVASVRRGEEQDLTGFGCWRIFCDHLEHAMDVKVITRDQWDAFVAMEKEHRELVNLVDGDGR